jgi:ferredoxin-NADP reductase
VERAAVLGGLSSGRRPLRWQLVTIREIRGETPRAKTLVLGVPDWPGHLAGQHADIRLTADDGYQAERSYSLASAPDDPAVELTIELVDDGEVSPYLIEDAVVGDSFELRGPIGGYFVWDGSDPSPVLLIGGGSGLVPLRAILRHHAAIDSQAEMRLLLSARSLDDVLYRHELDAEGDRVKVDITLTRSPVPDGWTGFTRRIDREMLAAVAPAPEAGPRFYVCGPTPFVESAADLLVGLGHDPARVYTERFGPTGG